MSPQWQRWLLAICLGVAAVALLWSTAAKVDEVNAEGLKTFSVPWSLPSGASLRPGPPGFYYDAAQANMTHRGPLSVERQMALRELLVLAPPEMVPTLTPSASATSRKGTAAGQAAAAAPSWQSKAASDADVARRGYYEAIERLAAQSAERQRAVLALLLVLGALGGALGAVLRSIVDFVGHACYTGKLDLRIWWPLYVTRPLVGGILGFVLIVLVKGQLLVASEVKPTDESFWWLGLAIIGGFSTIDVTQRLRLAAKALFGVESKPGQGSPLKE